MYTTTAIVSIVIITMTALLSVKHPILAEQQCHGNNVKTKQSKHTRINFLFFFLFHSYQIIIFFFSNVFFYLLRSLPFNFRRLAPTKIGSISALVRTCERIPTTTVIVSIRDLTNRQCHARAHAYTHRYSRARTHTRTHTHIGPHTISRTHAQQYKQ